MKANNFILLLLGLFGGAFLLIVCFLCSCYGIFMFAIIGAASEMPDPVAPAPTGYNNSNLAITTLYENIPGLSSNEMIQSLTANESLMIQIRKENSTNACIGYVADKENFDAGLAINFNCDAFDLDQTKRVTSIEVNEITNQVEVRQLDFLMSRYKTVNLPYNSDPIISDFSIEAQSYYYFVTNACRGFSSFCMYRYDKILGTMIEITLSKGAYPVAEKEGYVLAPVISPNKSKLLIPFSIDKADGTQEIGFQIYNIQTAKNLVYIVKTDHVGAAKYQWFDNNTIEVRDDSGKVIYQSKI